MKLEMKIIICGLALFILLIFTAIAIEYQEANCNACKDVDVITIDNTKPCNTLAECVYTGVKEAEDARIDKELV